MNNKIVIFSLIFVSFAVTYGSDHDASSRRNSTSSSIQSVNPPRSAVIMTRISNGVSISWDSAEDDDGPSFIIDRKIVAQKNQSDNVRQTAFRPAASKDFSDVIQDSSNIVPKDYDLAKNDFPSFAQKVPLDIGDQELLVAVLENEKILCLEDETAQREELCTQEIVVYTSIVGFKVMGLLKSSLGSIKGKLYPHSASPSPVISSQSPSPGIATQSPSPACYGTFIPSMVQTPVIATPLSMAAHSDRFGVVSPEINNIRLKP